MEAQISFVAISFCKEEILKQFESLSVVLTYPTRVRHFYQPNGRTNLSLKLQKLASRMLISVVNRLIRTDDANG